MVLNLNGSLTPSMIEHLTREIKIAERISVEAIILHLNAPWGKIHFEGELWSAKLSFRENPTSPGVFVDVVAVEGVHLYVRKKQ